MRPHNIGLLALASAAATLGSPARIGPGVLDLRDKAKGSISRLNRHTGQPHEHKREIARRLRQAEREQRRTKREPHP